MAEGITANGTPIKSSGQITPALTIGQKSVKVTSFIADDINCAANFLIGNDTITKLANNVAINYASKCISFDQDTVQFIIPSDPESSSFD